MHEQEQNPTPDTSNPYQPPKPSTAAANAGGDRRGPLIADGRRVPSGNGASWLARGWDLFKEAPGMWILLTLVYWVLALIIHIIPVGGLAFYLLSPLLLAGLLLGCESLAHDDELELGHLFAGFKHNAGSLLLVGLLYLVGIVAIFVFAAVVFVLVAGGASLAVLIKGAELGDLPELLASTGIVFSALLAVLVFLALIVPLLMAYWFAPSLVVFHELEPLEAMKMSFIGCLKNWGAFLAWGVLALVLSIIATLPAMLGWLVVWPMFIGSIYASYRDIYVGDMERIGEVRTGA